MLVSRPHRPFALSLIAGAVLLGGCGEDALAPPDLDPRTAPEVGTFAVPLDEDDPSAGTVDLAYARYVARRPSSRIGTLVMHFGGPGSSAIDSLESLIDTIDASAPELGARFDFAVFDELGVGASLPLTCDLTWAPFPGDDEGATAVAQVEGFIDECQRAFQHLDQLGTHRLVRDLDRFRAFLGEEEISFLGYSYGTMVALTYATEFPERTRAVVVDGVVDTRAPWAEWDVERGRGFERRLDAYFDACEQSGACTFGTSNPRSSFDALLARLPPASGDGRSRVGLMSFVSLLLGSESLFGFLDTYLAEAEFDEFSNITRILRQVDGLTTSSAVHATLCLDRPAPTVEELLAHQPMLEAAAPRFAPYMAGAFLPCALWPGERALVDPPVETIPSALLINTVEDPRTPLLWAERIAGRMPNAAFIEVAGFQHSVSLRGNDCVDERVAAYLIDGVVPADAVCDH